jgi:hypothetical protein
MAADICLPMAVDSDFGVTTGEAAGFYADDNSPDPSKSK